MSDDTRLVKAGSAPPDSERPDEAERDDSSALIAPGAAETDSSATTGGATPRSASLWSDAWGELRRSPLFLLSALIVAVVIVMAFFPSLFTDTNPRACSLSNSLGRPQPGHPFGYDLLGCDYYAQTIYGARASIAIGFLSVAVAATIAIVGGSITGYYGGGIDAVIARFADVFFAIPTVLGGIVILSALPNRGIPQVSLVLIVLGWPTMLRLMRSQVLSVKEADYVQAARALGAGDLRILQRHILPNAIAPVVVYATIYIGVIIGAEATLSFLGVGLQLPAISWGLMLSDAQSRILQAPHLLFFPGVFLCVTILAFLLMGDKLRDALDPRLR
jgi:ABC-type dipeptide/oligopeptide/nickel transport system permease subunit